MNCTAAEELLNRELDGELGRIGAIRLRRHLARCPTCGAERDRLSGLSAAVRASASRFTAPSDLAAHIGLSLDREPAPIAVVRKPRKVPMLAGGLAGALAGVALVLLVAPGQGRDDTALLDSHIRSLQPGHLMDVASTDHHTVKPWLSSRVDVSPALPDLAKQGFALIGGRMDYVDGHQAAVGVYRRREHVINLFAWSAPDGAEHAIHLGADRGFNIVAWQSGGIAYRAVSDVAAPELAEFARLQGGAG